MICCHAMTTGATGVLPGGQQVVVEVEDLPRHVLDLIPEAGIEVHRFGLVDVCSIGPRRPLATGCVPPVLVSTLP